MSELLIVLAAAGALVGLALRANRRLRGHARLPMQWWLSGEVTWTAPRVAALGFIPALAVGTLAALATMMQVTRPRAGQEGLELPVLVLLALMFLAVQQLHLWLIAKTVRTGDR